MAKSPDAFRTISEVSEWLDTPAHVLRFWESKFTQIKPVKRAGGRRYYRPDDMALLSGIKALLHDQGMTIKGAQKLLREKGVRHVAAFGQHPDIELEEDAAAVDSIAPLRRPVEGAPPARHEPAAWDPDDPWPADPAPDALATRTQGSVPVKQPEDQSPPPLRREVALPFVRSRTGSGVPPAPVPVVGAVRAFGPPPDLPDESAIRGAPGAISAALAADPRRVRANAARIAPLLAQLRAVARGIGPSGP